MINVEVASLGPSGAVVRALPGSRGGLAGVIDLDVLAVALQDVFTADFVSTRTTMSCGQSDEEAVAQFGGNLPCVTVSADGFPVRELFAAVPVAASWGANSEAVELCARISSVGNTGL